jgi:hypothetical protein
MFLHKLNSKLGYCNSNLPFITTRLDSKGQIKKVEKGSIYYFYYNDCLFLIKTFNKKFL